MSARTSGDGRPVARGPGERLRWCPTWPMRLLPRHGAPLCLVEWLTQTGMKVLAFLPVYTALVVTVVLVVQLWVLR